MICFLNCLQKTVYVWITFSKEQNENNWETSKDWESSKNNLLANNARHMECLDMVPSNCVIPCRSLRHLRAPLGLCVIEIRGDWKKATCFGNDMWYMQRFEIPNLDQCPKTRHWIKYIARRSQRMYLFYRCKLRNIMPKGKLRILVYIL